MIKEESDWWISTALVQSLLASKQAPEHPFCGQPSPETPEDYIGRGENHTVWKNRNWHKPQKLEEQMSEGCCKNTFNNGKSN